MKNGAFWLRGAAGVGLMAALALSGCSRLQVGLGLRVNLAKLPVTTMEASLPNGSAIAPGEKSPLVVTLTQTDGKVLVTSGKGKGKVQWKDLAVVATVVTVDKKGVLTLAHDPRVSEGKTGHITVTVPSHPGMVAELDIPLRYDYPFVAAYAGASGSSGSSGTNGSDGMSGSSGSMDPNNPSAGGDGTAGGNGSDGGDGGDGGNGPAVQVMVALRPGSVPLLEAGVMAAGHKERFYLVNPQGGSLTVKSDGGAGGSGGKGGSGGRGGSGGIGTPSGNNGSDGSSGRDGNSGSSGNGGSVNVTYDPAVAPYLAEIHVSNPGGPKPVFTEGAVAPLW
jgi:hypothetical protein